MVLVAIHRPYTDCVRPFNPDLTPFGSVAMQSPHRLHRVGLACVDSPSLPTASGHSPRHAPPQGRLIYSSGGVSSTSCTPRIIAARRVFSAVESPEFLMNTFLNPVSTAS